MIGLTKQQTAVLAVIRRHIAQQGWPPTHREIADAMGFASVNAASDHLLALAAKGAIKLGHGRARGIKVLERAS